MDYDFDIPRPSIEKDDSPALPNSSTNTRSVRAETVHQQQHQQQQHHQQQPPLDTAAETPLAPSSPARSPRKTPRLQYHGSPPRYTMSSPTRGPSSTSSPLNPDRRSSTPLLQTKRSTTSLKRGETPLRQLSSSQSSYSLQPSSLPSGAADHAEKKPPVTAASVARDYFQKEMLLHEPGDGDARTVMFIHDSCYGHRYARPRSSKSVLSSIVERPERIHATVLGLSAAYVRMGGRHAGGLAPPHPDRDPFRGGAVPFQIRKSVRSVSLNSAAATHVHGQKWMEELQIMCDSAEAKLALNGKELVRPIGYGKDESGHPLPKLHEGDLYLCAESLHALEGCLGGVCDAVDAVCGPGETRRAFVCIRPPGHHCSANYPSGFCWINNVHVAITHAAISHGLTHAAIIDFDLHHGDGSQMVAWEHNRKALGLPKNAAMHKKTPIGYFSLHDINSYPCEMGDEDKVRNASLCIDNAHGQSVWNVHLEPWKTPADFWRLYQAKYAVLIHQARRFLRHHTEKLSTAGVQARAAIFLSAGFDASEWEGEGMQRHKVNVPTEFYARFTADVVRLADEDGLGVDGRVVSVLEGGYSDRALTSGVLSHVCGLAHDGGQAATSEPMPEDGLSTEMRMKLGLLGRHDSAAGPNGAPSHTPVPVDPEWWNVANLEALEALCRPPAGPAGATKGKDKAGNYSSPTQASTAKMTDHARVRRSLSAQLERIGEPEPIPPPPAVDWAVAAYELSRLLIPADRPTVSCRYDELNAEATRGRRDRQSAMGLPTAGDQRMQLRDRKAKPSDDEVTKPVDRRKTIAAVADLPEPSLAAGPGDARPTTRPRRRSSGTSSVLSGLQNMQISDAPSVASSVVSDKPKKPVVGKKPRALAAPRAPRNPSTARAPSAQMAPAASRLASGAVPDPRPASHGASAVAAADGLSAGLKKMTIKLHVPSPEENALRGQQAAEAPTKKTRPKKPAVPKGPKAMSAANKAPSTSMQPVVEEEHHRKPLLATTSSGTPSVPAYEPPVLATPFLGMVPPEPAKAVPAKTVPAVAPALSGPPPSSSHVTPSGAGAHRAPPAEERATTGAAAATASDCRTDAHTAVPSTPSSVKRTKSDLPVFTSSSPIPFGRPAFSHLNENSQPSASPQAFPPGLLPVSHPSTTDAVTDSAAKPALAAADAQPSIGSDASETSGPSRASDASVWDVPDTPHRPQVGLD